MSLPRDPDSRQEPTNGGAGTPTSSRSQQRSYGGGTMSSDRLMSTSILELPHYPDGQIDYTTLGNMMSATLMSEVLHVSYVDHEFGNKWSGSGFKAATDWQFYYKEHNVVIFRKKIPNSRIDCFMGRGVVDAPLEQVAEYINRFETRFEWDNLLVKLEVCKRFSENDWLIYLAHEATKCLLKQKRDFLYHSRTAYVDEKYIQASVSVEDPDYPECPPYIRAEIRPGTGWVLEKYDGSECSTLVSYLAHLDLKKLPPLIVNRVLRRQPLAIHYINQKLSSPAKYFTCSIPSSIDSVSNLSSLSTDQPRDTYEEFHPVSHDMNRTDSYRQRRKQHAASHSESHGEVYPWITAQRDDRGEYRPKAHTIASFHSSEQSTSTVSSAGLPEASPRHLTNGSENGESDVVVHKEGTQQYSRQAQCHGPLLIVASGRSRGFTNSLPNEVIRTESLPESHISKDI